MKELIALIIIISIHVHAKEIALTFDDAPGETTLHFKPEQRTNELIRILKELNVPPVIIFANPCKGGETGYLIEQLQKFKADNHIIGNHTCNHLRLDNVGFESFTTDIEKADKLLNPLMPRQKLFRYPYFNEGKDVETRNRVRSWLTENGYKNISSSVDNEDPIFSAKINEAKALKKKIDYKKVKKIFLKHILEGTNYFEKLGRDTLGYSPKHIILLHQKDATVLFLSDLITELRKQGWTIISAEAAINDPLYSMQPNNTLSTFGILAQVAQEKSGNFKPYYNFDQLKRDLNRALGLKDSER